VNGIIEFAIDVYSAWTFVSSFVGIFVIGFILLVFVTGDLSGADRTVPVPLLRNTRNQPRERERPLHGGNAAALERRVSARLFREEHGRNLLTGHAMSGVQ
jgi:hypothetical protein